VVKTRGFDLAKTQMVEFCNNCTHMIRYLGGLNKDATKVRWS
jgi:hypothetical protein